MMTTDTLRLSVEELAFVLTQIGELEASKELIDLQLGPGMSQAEAEARMLSAAHSLMARGLVDLSDDGLILIAPLLEQAGRTLGRAEVTLQLSRADPERQTILTYHFSRGAIVEQRIENGVVHVVTPLRLPAAVVEAGMAFFGVARATPPPAAPLELPADLLSALKDERDVDEVRRRLGQAGAAEQERAWLAEDIVNVSYRGAILRVEHAGQAEPAAERGLLVLRGPERLWLLRPLLRGRARLVTVLPGTERLFQQEVAALLA